MSTFKCNLCQNSFNEQFVFFEHLKEHYGLGQPTKRDDNLQNVCNSISAEVDLDAASASSNCETSSASGNTEFTPATTETITPESNHEPEQESSEPKSPLSGEPSESTANAASITTATIAGGTTELAVTKRIASLIEKFVYAKSATANILESQTNNTKLVCTSCSRVFKREKKFRSHVALCCSSSCTSTTNNANAISNQLQSESNAANSTDKITNSFLPSSFSVSSPNSTSAADEPPLAITTTASASNSSNSSVLLDSQITDEIIEKINHQVQLLNYSHLNCNICETSFPTKIKLDLHLRKCHSEIYTKKKKGFSSAGILAVEEDLSLTASAATGSPIITSADGNPAAKSGTAVTGRRTEVLKCTECDRVFNHRNSLVYHMRSHTGERPHRCDSCGKSFFATSALKVHQRLHTGDKPFKCDHCGRNFRQWGDLKYHVISIHSNIRSYQCEFCGKDFARKYSLIVHRRIHTGERNYKCDYCGKCFRAASYLQNHRRIHTGEKPHSCVICSKPFRVRSDMKRHMASHTRDHSQQSSNSTRNNHNNASHNNGNLAQITVHQTTNNNATEVLEGRDQIPNVITLNGFQANQIVTIGSQQLSLRDGDTIQVSMLSDGRITVDQAQQLGIDTTDLTETAMITLSSAHGGRSRGTCASSSAVSGTSNLVGGTIHSAESESVTATTSSSTSMAASAVVGSEEELPEGVLYSTTTDGTVETVAIRESNTGTLYVWPVYMN